MNRNEVRVTDKSGGQKCSKLAQMSDIPPSILLELMEHYGRGAEKYPGDKNGPNYSKGYKWSLSYNALMRHALLAWAGEDVDEETGSLHWIAAAWHCMCLAFFTRCHPEGDDRWELRHVLGKALKGVATYARKQRRKIKRDFRAKQKRNSR